MNQCVDVWFLFFYYIKITIGVFIVTDKKVKYREKGLENCTRIALFYLKR